MSDPTKLDFADYFAAAVTAGVAVISGVLAWFRSTHKTLHGRIDSVEGCMRDWDSKHAEHSTDLAVVKTCQQNTADRLELINVTTRDTNAKIESLNEMLMQVLLAVKKD